MNNAKLSINFDGNKKLKNTSDKRFMIFNLSACITCPYATPHCKRSCYAKRAERYTTCKQSRYENFILSQRNDFTAKMISIIENKRLSRGYNDKKRNYIPFA